MADAAQVPLIGKVFDRRRFGRLADGLAVAVAVSLPWSTSATGILIALWLLAVLPTLDFAGLRRGIAISAAGLPVALWALGLLGMLWADVAFAERVSAFRGFHKLLVIPILIIQFRSSENGPRVLGGFLVSCTALLALSWISRFWPSLSWTQMTPGVPVKDYIIQSGEFLLCAFALGHLALNAWQADRRASAVALAALALLFLANIAYVATGRTSLVAFVVLLLLFGLQRLAWKETLGLLIAGVLLAAAAWMTSPYLQTRTLGIIDEVQRYQMQNATTSSGYRLEFWRKSLDFAISAPVIGHGMGSTLELFRHAAVGDEGASSAITGNPHNQTLEIAVQLGLVGVSVLYAMWIAHGLLFCASGLAAWLGLAVVMQNIVGSLFLSYLFDFTTGWTYVFGVGVLGGMILSQKARAERVSNIGGHN